MDENRCVLIVEDEQIEREMLLAQTRDCLPDSFTVLGADNGIRALELCQEHSPDIVLIDINIPGINGLALIEALRDFHFPGQILITTAYDRFDYARRAIRFGVIDYLLKPIDESALRAGLEKCQVAIEEENARNHNHRSLQNSIRSAFSYAEAY